MGTRRGNQHVLEEAKSLGTSFVTDVTEINFQDNVGYIISCTSITANTGEFTVQARVRVEKNKYSPWADLALDLPAQLAGADTIIEVALNQLPYHEVRLSFADSGGDGVCDIYIASKGLGG